MPGATVQDGMLAADSMDSSRESSTAAIRWRGTSREAPMRIVVVLAVCFALLAAFVMIRVMIRAFMVITLSLEGIQNR